MIPIEIQAGKKTILVEADEGLLPLRQKGVPD